MASGAAGLSGKLTMVERIEPADGAEVEAARAGSCVTGPTKATGATATDGWAETAATGALLMGALWRPTE